MNFTPRSVAAIFSILMGVLAFQPYLFGNDNSVPTLREAYTYAVEQEITSKSKYDHRLLDGYAEDVIVNLQNLASELIAEISSESPNLKKISLPENMPFEKAGIKDVISCYLSGTPLPLPVSWENDTITNSSGYVLLYFEDIHLIHDEIRKPNTELLMDWITAFSKHGESWVRNLKDPSKIDFTFVLENNLRRVRGPMLLDLSLADYQTILMAKSLIANLKSQTLLNTKFPSSRLSNISTALSSIDLFMVNNNTVVNQAYINLAIRLALSELVNYDAKLADALMGNAKLKSILDQNYASLEGLILSQHPNLVIDTFYDDKVQDLEVKLNKLLQALSRSPEFREEFDWISKTFLQPFRKAKKGAESCCGAGFEE